MAFWTYDDSSHTTEMSQSQWRIQGGGGGPAPLILDQTKARRAKKKFLETAPQATFLVRLEAFTTNRSEIGGQKNYNPTVSSL